MSGIEIAIVFPEKTLSEEEIARIRKQLEQIDREIETLRARLADEKFLGKAPANVVEQHRQREVELEARRDKLSQNLGD